MVKEELSKEGQIFKDKINQDALVKIMEDCPKEWRPMKENESMLIQYLLYRINHIDIIISTILNYLRNGGIS